MNQQVFAIRFQNIETWNFHQLMVVAESEEDARIKMEASINLDVSEFFQGCYTEDILQLTEDLTIKDRIIQQIREGELHSLDITSVFHVSALDG